MVPLLSRTSALLVVAAFASAHGFVSPPLRVATLANSDGHYAVPSRPALVARRRLSQPDLVVSPPEKTTITRTSPAQPYAGPAGGVERANQRSVALVGSLPGFACYALALRNVCLTPLFSPMWFVNQLILVAASFMLSSSLLPTLVKRLDARMGVRFWAVLSGAHAFASSAPAILWAMLSPILELTTSKVLFAFSCVLITIGGLAEIFAHTMDGWWFYDEAEAASGDENKVFSICLVGAFAFLALAFDWKYLATGGLFGLEKQALGLLAAIALPAAVTVKALDGQSWGDQKPFVYASQGIASIVTCAALGFRLRSLWPLLYFVQSFTIVRNGKRILESGEQHLHCLPSVYGWFSYVVPFGLAVTPATSAAPIWVVGAAAAASIWATGKLEDLIVNWAGASRARDEALDDIFDTYDANMDQFLDAEKMRALLTDTKREILDDPTAIVRDELLQKVLASCGSKEGDGEVKVPRTAALKAIKRYKALLFRKERVEGTLSKTDLAKAFARGELQSFLGEARQA